ncbi:hypothetical protein Q4555_03465 [Octadecabacter sp. 1_MG-2023]|uniref:hypothetical protein n=1 Tax=unclassified Octadecabacter TaxID=196158 RepID=UPI001C09C17E|nr:MULTISPECIES: hypothetical protein [unclassified Octadecabacter]MBU2992838.1 hypothetical protein [Octadecabacter sp. B2R22]MDO6733711.1 hypothetical protein [Octadecabacter sp. 1_MG-2023]
MIKLAFTAVILLAGILTFSAFYLAKGSEGQPTEITTGTPDGPSPAAQAPDTPEVEKLFFLRGIDFEIGEITLVLFQAGPDHERLIIRDQDALLAAQDKAFVNTTTPDGEEAGSLLLNMMGAPSEETIAQIFRDDVLIAAVSCPSSSCGHFADSSDINYAGLTDISVPHQTINDEFSTYETYIATIEGIANDPNYMLLDQRPLVDFPLAQRPAHLIVELPNVITDDASFDPTLHEALVQTAIVPLLPDGADLDWVQITDQGPAVLADKDNNHPVMAGGVPIVFTDAQFYSVRARINGVTTLPTDVYNALTQASLRQVDIDAAFPDFVTSRLQTDCVDCYLLKVEGGYSDEAHAFDWRSEAYYLNYYDLREAP